MVYGLVYGFDMPKRNNLGCDAGPTDGGGDWLFRDSDGEWDSFRQRAGGESINWNIRGIITE